jgi:hypothetical protein
MELITLESCHSTWIFDTREMRFRRILKDIEVGHHWVSTEWRHFSALEIASQSESFTVFLNEDRSRMIRSWRHTHDCIQCGGHMTAELSLQDIRDAACV